MKIGNGKGPFAQLSTMSCHSFEYDGVQCNSIESFLQSLKFEKTSLQASICSDKAKNAKERGKKAISWDGTGIMHWKGDTMDRFSDKYIYFLENAIHAVARSSPSFLKALTEVQEDQIVAIGKSKELQTPMTEAEYCKVLKRVRRYLLRG